MVTDSACKMETENTGASYESRYEGKTYHICCMENAHDRHMRLDSGFKFKGPGNSRPM